MDKKETKKEKAAREKEERRVVAKAHHDEQVKNGNLNVMTVDEYFHYMWKQMKK
jgi:hypothetical protein